MCDALKSQQLKAKAAAHLDKIERGPTVTEVANAPILKSAFFNFKEDDEGDEDIINLVVTGVTMEDEATGGHTVTGEVLAYFHIHKWLYTSTGWFRIEQFLPDIAARFVPPMIIWSEAMLVLGDTQKELIEIASS